MHPFMISSPVRAALRVAPRRAAYSTAVAAIVVLALACSGAGGPTPTPGPAPSPNTGRAPSPELRGDLLWPVKTRENIDLWLHGFALLQVDSTSVPFFQRGYRDGITAEKNRTRLVTQLDANHDKLAAQLAATPSLISGQFVALYFGSWEEMRQASDLFLRAEGNPRASQNVDVQRIIATFAAYFPNQAERDWLRLFVVSLDDESRKFYHAYWTTQQAARATALAAADSVWQKVYRPKLRAYLNNTQQHTGELMLSLPLDGEGRTLTSGGQNVVAVGFPADAASAASVVYTFAHEVAGAVTTAALADNTTPAEKRAGAVDRYSSIALVRAGALLLQRVAPDLVPGYVHYYLAAAKFPDRGGDPMAALASAFPLPEAIRAAIARQLDVVLGGI
jgi:hypothetical protein